jgi:hypothetical protein
MPEFRRGVPRPLVVDRAVKIDASDFCQCDYPVPSDWGPELCGNCKRLVDHTPEDPWGVGWPE